MSGKRPLSVRALSGLRLLGLSHPHFGRVAQLAEHSTLNRQVVGSIPTASTNHSQLSRSLSRQRLLEIFAQEYLRIETEHRRIS